ncbi:unnamed protein product [Sympodiomycopsis kandeliae]
MQTRPSHASLGQRGASTRKNARKIKLVGVVALVIALASLQGIQAAPAASNEPSNQVVKSSRSPDRSTHPLPRSLLSERSVEAPLGQRSAQNLDHSTSNDHDNTLANLYYADRSEAPEYQTENIKRQSHAAPRQGVVSSADSTATDDEGQVANAAPLAASAAAPANTVLRAAAAPVASSAAPVIAAASAAAPAATSSSNPIQATLVPVSASSSNDKTSSSASKASSTSSKSPSSSATSDHTGFTLTDTDNKLYALWIVVLIAGIFGGLFVILCAARWCFFRPHGKQSADDDAYLTGGAAGSRGIRAGAKSLRKALTKRKLAGSSFARRKQEGSVLLEIGDEVFAVSPAVAEEYQAAKRLFGGSSGSSNGHGTTPGSTGSNPFSWNGKAYLAQVLARHDSERKQATSSRSKTTPMNIDAWTRSASTLISDNDEKGSRNRAYGADKYADEDDEGKPRRNLSQRLAAGFRAAMRGNRDEDDELGDPEKTTDLNDFLPVITRNGPTGQRDGGVARGNAQNGWNMTLHGDRDDAEERINRPTKQAARRLTSTPRAAPTPITKDTPRMEPMQANDSRGNGPVPPHRPSPAVLQKSSAQQTRMQPRGVALDDKPTDEARARIVSRRFPHDPVLLNGPQAQPQEQPQQQRAGTVKKVRVNSTAEAIGTPIWEQNARSRPQDKSRVVSSPPMQNVSFQPGQMIARGTVPQQDDSTARPVSHPQTKSAAAGRDRLRESRAVSASFANGPKRSSTQQQGRGQQREASQRSHRANTVRVPNNNASARGGEEVRLDRGA